MTTHTPPKIGLALWLLLGLAACQSDGLRDIRDYYFPLRLLTDGLVYEYQPANPLDSLGPVYWYYRSIETDSAMYLTGVYYEHDFQPQQLVREELVGNGMLLNDLYLYQPDTATNGQHQTRAEVLSGNVFPFLVSPSANEVFLYKVRFQQPSDPGGPTTLIVNRFFLADTTINFQGQTYPAVRFGLRGLAEIRDTINGDIEPHFEGEEIYAHRLGLVYYRRNFGGAGYAYRLHDRYPMTQLEEKAQKALRTE